MNIQAFTACRQRASALCLFLLVILAKADTTQGQAWNSQSYPYPDSVLRGSLLVDNDENVWAALLHHRSSLAYNGKIAKFDGANWKVYGVADGLPSDSMANSSAPRSIVLDRQGNVWAAGKGGVARYNASQDRWETFKVQDSLAVMRRYLSIAFDASGQLWTSSSSTYLSHWVGSLPVYKVYSQIHRLDGDTWITYDFTDQALSRTEYSSTILFVDSKGSVWGLGVQNYDTTTQEYFGGLRRFGDQGWETFDLSGVRRKLHLTPTSIVEDRAGRFLIGTSDGGMSGIGAIQIFDGKNWSIDSTVFAPNTGQVFDMQSDLNGRMWIAPSSGKFGVVVYDTGKIITNFTTQNSALLFDAANSIAAADDGSMWVATYYGLTHFTPSTNSVGLVQKRGNVAVLYPNPFRNSSSLSFFLEEQSSIRIACMDESGRSTFTFIESLTLPKGPHQLILTNPGLTGPHLIVLDVVDREGRTQSTSLKALLLK